MSPPNVSTPNASALIERELVVVSGKGGVGRTTVAAALARAAADAGKRVLVAGSAPADRIGHLFGRAPLGPEIAPLGAGVDGVNMTPESALHEYGRLMLRSEMVVRALFENRPARAFLSAVPGLDAYALLGKAWWHTTERTADGRRRYDLVILDGPASGHAPLMLGIPDSILQAMPKGPLSGDARAIHDLLRDPARAAVLIVTLPEELPAREAAELATIVRRDLALPLAPLVVNALPSTEAAAPELGAVLDAARAGADPAAPLAGRGALWTTLRLAAGARDARRRAERIVGELPAATGLPVVTLPRLPTIDVGPGGLGTLAAALATELARISGSPPS